MIEAHFQLDTEGLIKARTDKRCTTSTCRREIRSGEYYNRYFQRGENLQCIVCVAKAQILNHRYHANGLEKWLREIGE